MHKGQKNRKEAQMATKAAKKAQEIRDLDKALEYYERRLQEQDVPEKAREKYRKDLEETTTQLLKATREWRYLTTKKEPRTGGQTT
jgi:hypothetical protein